MDHNFGVGQSQTLALGPGGQQEGPHGGRHADADGGHVALDILHGIVDGHARRDGAAGAVDIELDILIRVLGLQVQQLGNHQRGGGVVDLLGQHDNPVVRKCRSNARPGWSVLLHRELSS